MRYKAMFIAGFAAGFVAGARAGRGTYDKMADYAQQVAGHPKVQQATSVAQAKATEFAKTAAAKAPDYAKNAASGATSAAKTAQAQVVSQVRGKIPGRFGGSADSADPAEDGTVTEDLDDVAQDGNLVYPAEGSPSVNGTIRHYTPGTP